MLYNGGAWCIMIATGTGLPVYETTYTAREDGRACRYIKGGIATLFIVGPCDTYTFYIRSKVVYLATTSKIYLRSKLFIKCRDGAWQALPRVRVRKVSVSKSPATRTGEA